MPEAQENQLATTDPLVQNTALVRNQLAQAELGRMRRFYTTQTERIEQALNLTTNLETAARGQMLSYLIDGARDINADCGYPEYLTPDHYLAMYAREGAAKRVVHCMPEESWALDPEVYEDDNPDTDTAWETAWKACCIQHNVYGHLLQADILSGLGQFGILLFGLDDGKQLKEPVAGVNADGTYTPGNPHKLLYLREFNEPDVLVKEREKNMTSPRYGQPVTYRVRLKSMSDWGISGFDSTETFDQEVHWSRVIHLADNRTSSPVFGTPRMKAVYNRLYDLRKAYAGSGEALWKGGFPGMAFEVDPQVAAQGIELDKESIRSEMNAYMNSLQRYIAITGVSAKTLPPVIADPTATVTIMLQNIALTLSIPYRVLFGTEEGKLAGTQDARAWNKRLQQRQKKYIEPYIIRPFVERLISYGVLPAPALPLKIEWPDLNLPTAQDKAGVALTQTQAMQTYVAGGVSTLVPPHVFFTHFMGLSTEVKDAIAEGMADYAGTPAGGGVDAEGNPVEGNLWDNLPGAPNPRPDGGRTGGILADGNVQGSTGGAFGAKGYPRTDKQLFAEPSTNSAQNAQTRTFAEFITELFKAWRQDREASPAAGEGNGEATHIPVGD